METFRLLQCKQGKTGKLNLKFITQREKDRGKDRGDRQTGNRKKKKQRGRKKEKQRDKETERQLDTDTEGHRQSKRQTHKKKRQTNGVTIIIDRERKTQAVR